MDKIEKRFLRQKKMIKSVSEDQDSWTQYELQNVQDVVGQSPRMATSAGNVLDEFEKKHTNLFKTPEFVASVAIEEVESLIVEVRSAWDGSKFDEMFSQCRKQVISSIVGPLGLGQFVAAYDKVGGNVDTIHNARVGVYATDRERVKFETREKYDDKEYHKDKSYIKVKNQEISKIDDDGFVDSYTGNKTTCDMHIDHVVSASEIHNDPARILADVDGVEVANTETNLKPTADTINTSKNSKNAQEFSNYLTKVRARRDELLVKSSLSENEKEELIKLNKLNEVDNNLLIDIENKSRKGIDFKYNKSYYCSAKFVKSITVTSSVEAGKMGIQQAIGLLLTDLFEACFIEIKDSCGNGFSNISGANSFFEALSIRLRRVGSRILEDWKSVVSAFKDGAISGFVSNMVTTAINAFCTTAKNIVRLIREGFFSLLKAFKTILFRPEGTTLEQSADAALKLVAAGVVTIGGISLQEFLNLHLRPLFTSLPIIGSFSEIFISIIVGGVTAVTTSLAVYFLDKIDFFGVHDEERHKFMMETIKKENVSLDTSIHEIFNSVVTIWEV